MCLWCSSSHGLDLGHFWGLSLSDVAAVAASSSGAWAIFKSPFFMQLEPCDGLTKQVDPGRHLRAPHACDVTGGPVFFLSIARPGEGRKKTHEYMEEDVRSLADF